MVESETIATEAIADLDPIERQLDRAAKALEDNKPEDAAKALAMALVRGIDFRFSKEDSQLASARDAIWLARRSLEENNAAQALVNLAVARQRLRVYREVLSQDQRQEVDQMLREVDQLEAQLRQEGTRPASRAERARQGSTGDALVGSGSTVGSSGISDRSVPEPRTGPMPGRVRASMRHGSRSPESWTRRGGG